MPAAKPYHADPSLRGKLRRRSVRLLARQPARLRLERAMVSFTFDDVPASAAGLGAQILGEQGALGTFYVSAGLLAQPGPMGRHASACELAALAGAGHEIGCHTYSHLDCARTEPAEILRDIERNAEAMAAWGARAPTTFAYPYGEVALKSKAALGERFGLLRALHPGLIVSGADLNQAPSVAIGDGNAQTWLRRAEARRAWLILHTHDVSERPSPWGCTPAALAGLVQAAKAAGLEIITVAEGARRLA